MKIQKHSKSKFYSEKVNSECKKYIMKITTNIFRKGGFKMYFFIQIPFCERAFLSFHVNLMHF